MSEAYPSGWIPGQPISSPTKSFTDLDPDKLGTARTYKLMTASIIPRPIAFVSTLGREGKGNLAPFSFFNGVSSNPPCLVLSITRKPDGTKKDTLLNIEQTGEFVVNTVSEWMAEPMHQCSAVYPYGVNEMEKVGLTPLPSIIVSPPRVKESPVHFECRLENRVEIGEGQVGSSTLIIGRILKIHVWEEAYSEGRILTSKLRPLGRLAGRTYGKLGEVIELPPAIVK